MTKTLSHALWLPTATLFFIGCQTAPNAEPSISPALKTPAPIQTQPPIKPHAPQGAATHLTHSENVASSFASIELAFAQNNCPLVLEVWSKLNLPESESKLQDIPEVSAAAVAVCLAQRNPLDANQNRVAAKVLTHLEQRSSPLLDKAWLAKNIASFYVAVGDFEAASSASKREKAYLEQHAMQFATLNGGNPTAITSAAAQPTNPATLQEPAAGLEKTLLDAKAALNSGDPATAVTLLDSIPEPDKSEKVRRMRKDAAEAHVKDLRTRARQQYMRAQGTQVKESKLDALRQCLEINNQILAKYPDTPSRPGIERSLSSIKSEIEFISKGH